MKHHKSALYFHKSSPIKIKTTNSENIHVQGDGSRITNVFQTDNSFQGEIIQQQESIAKQSCGEKSLLRGSDIAIIIAPGGSYHHLGLYNEGYLSARFFASMGIDAFVLRYRTAQAGYHHPAMLQDIQRAIQLVRKMGYCKVGLIGYSAGGHLVAMAAIFGGAVDTLLDIGVEHGESLQVDFVVPVYPVVSMADPIAHKWSRRSLLGRKQSQYERDALSLEKQVVKLHDGDVAKDTQNGGQLPPFYIVACKDDPVVEYQNSVVLYSALQENGVDATFKTYEWGGHGFGMLNNAFMKTFHWNEDLQKWVAQKIK